MIGASAQQNLPPIQAQLDVIERETEMVAGAFTQSQRRGIRRATWRRSFPPGKTRRTTSPIRCFTKTSGTSRVVSALRSPARASREYTASTPRYRAAAKDALVLSYHFPFPSLGYLSQKGKGWQWEPIE